LRVKNAKYPRFSTLEQTAKTRINQPFYYYRSLRKRDQFGDQFGGKNRAENL
jgi:hypothetical protein